jgi:hypothetical protein
LKESRLNNQFESTIYHDKLPDYLPFLQRTVPSYQALL